MILLDLKNVKVMYGKVEAVKGASLDIAEKEIVVVIGANGYGLSSLEQPGDGQHKQSKFRIRHRYSMGHDKCRFHTIDYFWHGFEYQI